MSSNEVVAFVTPADADLAADQTTENAAASAAVGITASATDPDAGDTVTYSVGDPRFAIDANSGVIARSGTGTLDFETEPSITLTVTATSSDTSFVTQDFTLGVLDANEVVVFDIPADVDPAADQIAENATAGTQVGITASATDPDAGDTVTYSVDDPRFAIDANSGVITRSGTGTLDSQAEPQITLTVTATSSDASFVTQDFTLITVSGNDDAPTATDDSVLTNLVDGSVITIPIESLLDNDGDPNSDQLTGFTIVVGSITGGSAVVNGGNVEFTPSPGAFAAGSFSYTVSDGVLTSAPALVTIAAASGDTITGGANNEVLVGDDVSLTLSTTGNATLGGLKFGDDDLVDYDSDIDTATRLFDGGTTFSNTNQDIDAVQVLANGHVILSTRGDATLGGLTFGDDDLVDYDPGTDTATLFFDGGALFSNTFEDVNAVHVLANGHIILSTRSDATLGGLTFGDDDLVDYDPATDTATILLDGGTLFSNTTEDVDAVYVTGSDVLTSGLGEDWLDGGAGSDSLFGGAGDDVLVWDVADTTIDGGNESDTLRVESGAVDITTFTGTIAGIEQIDLEADAGANSATLTVQDVLDMSDTDSVTILGDDSDSIHAGIGWTDGGFDGSGNQIYTQLVGPSLATLIVDPDVSVNPDILA